jgi:ribosomal 50S subunit-recycling heat shock protein
VKAAHEVRAGDHIEVRLARRELELRVLEVPAGNVARRDAGRYVEMRRDTGRDTIGEVFEPEA